jgi:hypothetical protein
MIEGLDTPSGSEDPAIALNNRLILLPLELLELVLSFLPPLALQSATRVLFDLLNIEHRKLFLVYSASQTGYLTLLERRLSAFPLIVEYIGRTRTEAITAAFYGLLVFLNRVVCEYCEEGLCLGFEEAPLAPPSLCDLCEDRLLKTRHVEDPHLTTRNHMGYVWISVDTVRRLCDIPHQDSVVEFARTRDIRVLPPDKERGYNRRFLLKDVWPFMTRVTITVSHPPNIYSMHFTNNVYT